MEGWKERLGDAIPEDVGRGIDDLETQIALKREGKLDDRVFAESRLRRGVYGQRYDNGRRDDGTGVKELGYRAGTTKGPDTAWDAPGMQRIKLPFGRITASQMQVLADLAEEYADGVVHVTTRQDVQLHHVHIEDTPPLMRRLAAVGVTTQEACGNVVRNVTACPLAGVCHDEAFDVSAHAWACARFLMGHPDTQDFGRKFKIAFSGCADRACGLAHMHDLGFIAAWQGDGTDRQAGFEVVAGGGLGAVPHRAQQLLPFVAAAEVLPLCQAVARVFTRLGERRNRGRARLKFLVATLGIERFRQLVIDERAILPADPAWTDHLDRPTPAPERPTAGVAPGENQALQGFDEWRSCNVADQRQPGYAVLTVVLPLGDISSEQLRGLADTVRSFAGDARTSVEQNVVLRWVPQARLPGLHAALDVLGLAEPTAGSIEDMTVCPGTDTCKLGIASSRGLVAELRRRLAETSADLDPAARGLRVKVSGCFNSCGQHHIADIGFYGVSRNAGRRSMPHFQVVLGGQWTQNAGAFGQAIGAVPSKRVPQALDRIVGQFVQAREPGESFQAFTARLGKRALRGLLEELTEIPDHAVDPEPYSDWGDPREFTLGDLGIGECAGELVSVVDVALARAEAQVFDAQISLDTGQVDEADRLAYEAMLRAARALLDESGEAAGATRDEVVEAFRRHFYDTKRFFDPFAGGKFARYLFRRHQEGPVESGERAGELIHEAQLFVEAAHGYRTRSAAATGPADVSGAVAVGGADAEPGR